MNAPKLRLKFFLSVFLLLFSLSFSVFSQTDSLKTTDSLPKKSTYTPQKISKAAYASLLSAALPGAGQIYNRSYWQIKLPIIYTGYAVLGYLVMSNHDQYRLFRQAYISRKDQNSSTTSDVLYDGFSDESLLRQRDQFRRDRDFYLILTLLWHGLNIAEAATTSHLNEFSVKDDIGLRLKPTFGRSGLASVGFHLEYPLVNRKQHKQRRILSSLTP